MFGEGRDMEQEDSKAIDPYEHWGLVVYIARQIAGSYGIWQHYNELLQAGFLGLVEASRRYDPIHGVSIGTFVSVRIRGAIRDSLRAAELVRVPKERRQELRDVERAQEQIEQRLGRPPTQQELAEALGIPLAHLHAVARARIQVVSSDHTAQRDERPTPEEAVDARQRRTRKALLLQALDACIQQLPAPQNELFRRRKEKPPLPLAGRAQRVGITEAQAQQEESRAKAQVRACLATKGWTAEAVAEIWKEDVEA